MGQWYDGFRNGNVELGTCWVEQAAGFHIFRAASDRAGGRDINWLRGNNVASTGGLQRISHVLPGAADLSINVEWEYLFRKMAGDNLLRFWLFCNVASLDNSAAGTQGYYLYILGSSMRLYRGNGAGGRNNILGTYTWANDTNDHMIKVTREWVGVNAFWRVYFDNILVLGPGADGTYPTGLYYGWNCDERDQLGEILISS